MTFYSFLSFASAMLCGGLAAVVWYRDARAFVHQIFAIGMVVLALEAVFTNLSIQAFTYAEVVRWQRLRFLAAALLPGSWLLFSLSFARANYREFISKWRWVAVGAVVFPLALVGFFPQFLLIDLPVLDASSRWVLGLGWSGYVFFLFFLSSAVLILMNLERTLRASAGSIRWQIKFMILGLGALFAVRIYTGSQALLFSSINSTLEALNAGALIIAAVLISLSLLRARLLHVDIYLSQAFLYNSLTTLIVGIYFLAVGILAKAVSYVGLDDSQTLFVDTFFVFLTFLGLAIFLLSDELRQRFKRFVNRHFQRPRYDYREEWLAFAQQTAALVDMKSLCVAVAKMIANTFGVPAVTIWLLDDTQEGLILGGSTVFSEEQARGLKIAQQGAAVPLLRAVRDQLMPTDFAQSAEGWAAELRRSNLNLLREARLRYCVALMAGGECLGLVTLDDKVTKEPFSIEDSDLFRTVTTQAAASLLNVKLSERLLRAKELEAFQTLSTFFLHDLKNLASTLSLTTQNLPVHYDDPVFRDDALRTIQGSVSKINALYSRLSLLTKKLELQRTETDLNALVRDTLAGLNGSLRTVLKTELQPLPRVSIDPEQMEKVLINLLLNANEAIGDHGGIRVTTGQQDGWAVIAVSDTGIGMSREFIERSLFQLFHTTKSKGLGIGLFQSRMIVEAHRGRIEVESEEGKGSTFRVMLPVQRRG